MGAPGVMGSQHTLSGATRDESAQRGAGRDQGEKLTWRSSWVSACMPGRLPSLCSRAAASSTVGWTLGLGQAVQQALDALGQPLGRRAAACTLRSGHFSPMQNLCPTLW